jgi:hypothetical protein
MDKSLFQMLGWEVIPHIAISFLCLQNFAGGRNHTTKKVIKPVTSDHIPGSSALSPEVHGTPGVVVLYSKHSTKVDFVTDKHGNILNANIILLTTVL